MDINRLPEPLRRRMEEHASQSAYEQAQSFLRSYFGDADGLAEVWDEMKATAALSTSSLERDLAAVEQLLSAELSEGQLAQLVAWDANWVLDDTSDNGARQFLSEIASTMKTIISEAKSPR